jgi:hypothetical protein
MILLDGHNRWKISTQHGGIPFNIVKKHFGSREEALIWVIDNQLGRRNLPLIDRITLNDRKRSALAAMAKQKIGGDRRSEEYVKNHRQEIMPMVSRKEDRSGRTDYKIAKAAGTSEDTVRKVRAINNAGDQRIVESIRSGGMSINQAYNAVTVKKAEAEGRIPQTQAQKKRQEVAAAYERHEAYDQSGVANIADARQDREDRRTIALEWYGNMKTALKNLYWTGALNKAELFAEMRKVLTNEERAKLVERIQDARMVLDAAMSELED